MPSGSAQPPGGGDEGIRRRQGGGAAGVGEEWRERRRLFERVDKLMLADVTASCRVQAPPSGGEEGQVRASSRLANLYLQGQRLSMSWMGMISSEGRSDDSSSRTCQGKELYCLRAADTHSP